MLGTDTNADAIINQEKTMLHLSITKEMAQKIKEVATIRSMQMNEYILYLINKDIETNEDTYEAISKLKETLN